MDWLQATTLKELQACGSFKYVRCNIKDRLGKNLNLKARGWKDLLEIVKHLQSFTYPQAISEENSTSEKTSLYFKSEATRIIYVLMNLDGEQRLKELQITKSHYRDAQKAKEWRNEIVKIIHPDICKHPEAKSATSKLTELFNNMIRK